MKNNKLKRILLFVYIGFWTGFITFFTIYESHWSGYSLSFVSAVSSAAFYFLLVHIHAFYILPIAKDKHQYLKYALFTFCLLVALVIFRNTYVYLLFPQEGKYAFFDSQRTLYGFGIAVIALVISTPVKYSLDYFSLQQKQQELMRSKLEAELKYLKMQINPHFLFNTLNNLLYLTRKKSELAPKVVEQLADLMRYMLDNADKEKVDLVMELKFMTAYLELEKIRIPHIDVKLNINGEVKGHKIPPLTFLTLVENAFKHGIDKTKKNNYVYVTVKIKEDTLNFIVTNSLFSNDVQPKETGIGLDNLKRRLQLLYGNNYTYETHITEDNQYVSELTIPLD